MRIILTLISRISSDLFSRVKFSLESIYIIKLGVAIENLNIITFFNVNTTPKFIFFMNKIEKILEE